jgi:hypothetical protein
MTTVHAIARRHFMKNTAVADITAALPAINFAQTP